MARVFGSTRTVIGDLGKRPKYFDEMLKLFLCYSSAQGKVEGVQEEREVIDELRFLRMTHPFS
jgi:hypothetical protein